MKKDLILTAIFSIFISVIVMTGISYVFSWDEPSGDMPIIHKELLNTGDSFQYKAGEIGSVLFRDV